MNVVLLESLGISDQRLEKYAADVAASGHSFKAYEKTCGIELLKEECRDADVLMLANMKLPGEVIAAASHLKMIDVAFTGVDHVDMEECRKRSIPVCNASGYSTEAVAELTIAQMINLLRSVPQAAENSISGKDKSGIRCRELSSCKVGIIGTGNIGQRVAALCGAFGAEVVGYAPHARKEAQRVLHYVSMEELLAESDIVSLHCPLNSSTKGLIGKQELERMKKDAFLINMARGPVVDTDALAEALNSEKIAGAAVDVFDSEPPIATSNPLLNAKNCICTPHIGFFSEESMLLRADIVFDTLSSFFKGEIKRRIN